MWQRRDYQPHYTASHSGLQICSRQGPIVPLPDCEYIRKSVPIRDVARELGLRVAGNMVHCWRPDRHEHADRTASVGLDQRRNRAKCFVCDARALSPIDLVMRVRNTDLRGALRWITSRYDIPPAPKGRHLNTTARWSDRFRIGASGFQLEGLVRSGIWASLSPAQCKIIPVLFAFSDGSTGRVTISYRGLMRYSGVQSQSTISSALKRFRSQGFLRIEPRIDAEGFRDCNTYVLCLNDPAFVELANNTYQLQEEVICQERKLRKIERQKKKLSVLARRNTRGAEAMLSLPVDSLSNG